MWELGIARPYGSTVRKLLLFVASVIVAAFGVAALSTLTAHAAPETVKWDGTQIVDGDNIYSRSEDGTADDPRGIPEGAMVFAYKDFSTQPNTMHYIYFASNEDPDTAEQALYSTAKFDSSAPEDKRYTDITEATVVSIEPRQDPDAATTSCNQEGIGWIICPVSRWLASGMDYLYSAISGYLEVRPLETENFAENPMYRAWSIMRNFANVLFVVGFLVIIYSQITSYGISNYEIKKMLPRLVIAAILVNISYWICALAIDASNIAGYSIHDLFATMRENIVGPEGNSWDLANWQTVTDAILTAGAGAAAVSFGIYSIAASGGASIIMLLPLLVGLAMAVLVALLIMAARQAIITILLVISPLAFVAFLLPNTEKYFEKWRSVGTTMLLLFPIFSVLFGGAQLAGMLIIQNADHLNLIILGLAVQVAPLVITPLLIRFSGSLLGRIAGIVNNPNKGLIDRTRKWAGERAGQRKDHQIAKGQGFWANRARNIDGRRRRREGWQQANQSMSEANWNNTSAARDIKQYAMEAADTKELGETAAKAAYEQAKAGGNTRIRQLTVDIHEAKAQVAEAETKVSANLKEFEAGHIGSIAFGADTIARNSLQQRADRLKQTIESTDAQRRRTQSAQNIQTKELAEAFEAQGALRTIAGGIDPNGAQRAYASALSDQQKIRQEAVSNAESILDRSDLDAKDTLQIAKNISVRGITVTDDIREAAIKRVASSGVVPNINELITSVSLATDAEGGNSYFRSAIKEALNSNSNTPKYIGKKILDEFVHGIPGGVGPAKIDQWIKDMLIAGKLSAQELSSQDKDTLQRVFEALPRIQRSQEFDEALVNLREEIANVKEDEKLWNAAGDRKKVIGKLEQKIQDIL